MTERQKKILRENGLPEEYAKLTPRQKTIITDIGEMLMAVEAKYGKEFSYVGYTKETDESGVLLAKQIDSKSERDIITVRRSTEGGFVDSYLEIGMRDIYEIRLQKMVEKLTGFADVRIYSEIKELCIDHDGGSVGGIVADIWMFFDGSAISPETFEVITDPISEKLRAENCLGSVYFVLSKGSFFGLITSENFTDYLPKTKVLARKFINIQ